MFQTTQALAEVWDTLHLSPMQIQITGMGNSWMMETSQHNGKCWGTQTMGVTTGFAHGKVCCHSKKVQPPALKTQPTPPSKKKKSLQMYFQEPLLTVFLGLESWVESCAEEDGVSARAAAGHRAPPHWKLLEEQNYDVQSILEWLLRRHNKLQIKVTSASFRGYYGKMKQRIMKKKLNGQSQENYLDIEILDHERVCSTEGLKLYCLKAQQES